MKAEIQLHRAIVQWLDLALPAEAFYFHPANGEKRNPITAARLKTMGVKAGLHDLIVLYGGKAIGLEIKPKGRYLSPVQREVHRRFKNAGCDSFIVHSIEEAATALDLCGVPLSARAA